MKQGEYVIKKNLQSVKPFEILNNISIKFVTEGLGYKGERIFLKNQQKNGRFHKYR